MKKIIFPFAIILGLLSCNQKDIQQTTTTIRQADSLFTQAKDGIKTLDSISKIINDSAKLNSEIKKQTDEIQKNINLKNINVKNLDSLNAVLKKVTKDVSVGTDVVKTLDSANNELKKSKNPIDAITTITKTIQKVTKQTKAQQNPQSQPQVQTQPQSQTQIQTQPESDPLSKTANIEITVNDLQSSRATLGNILGDKGSEVFSESFSDINGAKRMEIGAKVPSRYFDDVISRISGSVGNISSKNITSEGKDYDANQMCDLNITLIEDTKHVAKDVSPTTIPDETQKDTFGVKSSDAFSKGFSGFKDVLVALIPFWPIAVIGGLIWYFVARSKRKKLEAELEKQKVLNQQLANQQMQQAQQSQQNQNTQNQNFERQYTPKPEDSEKKDDDDFSRFMPK